MAGYFGFSKSNNAVKAEEEGRFPAIRFAAVLSKRFRRYRGCTASDIRAAVPCYEYHHTSKYYNQTAYYGITDLSDSKDRENLRERIAARKEFQRLFKKHAIDGRVSLTLSSGSFWCFLEKKDFDRPEFWKDALERLRSQDSRGFAALASSDDD